MSIWNWPGALRGPSNPNLAANKWRKRRKTKSPHNLVVIRLFHNTPNFIRQRSMNHEKPKFSVITVCFNAGNTIEETLSSVFKQNCEQMECIVIDGGSTDSTVSLIKKYKNKPLKLI